MSRNIKLECAFEFHQNWSQVIATHTRYTHLTLSSILVSSCTILLQRVAPCTYTHRSCAHPWGFLKVPCRYCTVLHCTVLHCTALHCTALHCTALHCTALHCTALHCNVLYCTVLRFAMLCCAVLCCAVLYCTVLYSTAKACWKIVVFCNH